MNKLANNGLGNDNYVEIILGYEDDELREELCEGLQEFFEEKGLKVCIVESQCKSQKNCYDVIIHVIEWIGNLVHFSFFNNEGKSADLDVSINFLTTERILKQLEDFIEGLRLISD